MNKYIAFVALALTCLVAVSARHIAVEDDVSSELSLSPSNDEEIASLEGKAAVFSDYCIRSRDYVIGDIKTNTNGLAGNIFKLFFNGAENLGLEAVNVEREAAERLEKQIRNPESEIGAYDENNEVDRIIAEGQKSIQDSPNQPRSLFQGIVTTLAATKNVVTSTVLNRLNDIKSGFGLSTVTSGLRNVCDQVSRYDQELLESFEKTRQQLAEQDPELAKFELSDVGCVTVRRVVRLDGVCKFAQAAQNPLIKAISYRPIPSNQ